MTNPAAQMTTRPAERREGAALLSFVEVVREALGKDALCGFPAVPLALSLCSFPGGDLSSAGAARRHQDLAREYRPSGR